MEDILCKNVVSMKEWIKNTQEQDKCGECIIGIAGNWYITEAKKYNSPELTKNLKNHTDDAIMFAEELDRIKEVANEPLKLRLKELDCSMQSNF